MWIALIREKLFLMAFLTLSRPLGHCLVAPFAIIVKGFLSIDLCPFLVAFAALLGAVLTFLEGVMTLLAFQRGMLLMGQLHFSVLVVQNQGVVNGPQSTDRQMSHRL